MPQEATKDLDKSQEQVLDELGLESVKERAKGLKQEVKRFQDNIKLIEDSVADAKVRFETSKAIQAMVLAQPEKVVPEFKYQESKDYWDLRKKEIGYQIADNEKSFAGQLSMAEARIRDTKNSLKSSQDQLDKDLETLAKHGVKLDE